MSIEAAQFLGAVADNRGKLSCREAFYHALFDAAHLAIALRLKWTQDDIRKVVHSDSLYALAISLKSLSYVHAYEAAYDMRPYCANDVTPGRTPYLHMTGPRNRERLAIGFGVHVPEAGWAHVTTLTPDHVILTITRYDGTRTKVARRITLNHKKCAALFPAKRRLRATGGPAR